MYFPLRLAFAHAQLYCVVLIAGMDRAEERARRLSASVEEAIYFIVHIANG